MTEQGAIRILKEEMGWESDSGKIKAFEMGIAALEEIQQYREINKELQEKYHANVDIPLLMHHFIETIFEGEKHEGFCILTNEDANMWRQYKAIGTVEECREAVEKQRARKPIERIENEIGYYHCPNCDKSLYASIKLGKPIYCRNCGQKLDWSDEE